MNDKYILRYWVKTYFGDWRTAKYTSTRTDTNNIQINFVPKTFENTTISFPSKLVVVSYSNPR